MNKTALILTGVLIAAGSAYAIYVTGQRAPVDDTELAELENELEGTAFTLQEQLTADIGKRQLRLEEERSESKLGKELLGLCNAWIEFDANHPSAETAQNRDKTCGEYRHFIRTGELPDSDD